MSMTLKELKNRISAAKNIQQITRAMKLIAAAKMRKLESQIRVYREFLREITLLMEEVLRNLDDERVNALISHLRKPKDPSAPPLLVLFTADRGLCGAFNSNLIDKAFKRIDELLRTHDRVSLFPIGRKGEHSLSKLASRDKRLKVIDSITKVPDYPPLKLGERITQHLKSLFLNGEVSKIELVRPKYLKTIKSAPVLEVYLPLGEELMADLPSGEVKTLPRTDVTEVLRRGVIEPSLEEVLVRLTEMFLNSKIYGSLLELKVSEFSARLVAMTNATENAENLIKELMLQFFKKRQELITKELMDIVEAAEGLKHIS